MSVSALTLYAIIGVMLLIAVITLVVSFRIIDKQEAKEMQEIDEKYKNFWQLLDELDEKVNKVKESEVDEDDRNNL